MSQSVQVGNIYKHAPLYYVLAVTFCFGFHVNFNYFGACLILETASIYSKKEFSYHINGNTFTPEFKRPFLRIFSVLTMFILVQH